MKSNRIDVVVDICCSVPATNETATSRVKEEDGWIRLATTSLMINITITNQESIIIISIIIIRWYGSSDSDSDSDHDNASNPGRILMRRRVRRRA